MQSRACSDVAELRSHSGALVWNRQRLVCGLHAQRCTALLTVYHMKPASTHAKCSRGFSPSNCLMLKRGPKHCNLFFGHGPS